MLRRRMFLVMTFGLPALGLGMVSVLAVLYAILGGEPDPERYGYVDRWGRLPERVPFQSFLKSYDSEKEARAALLDGEVVSYYVVPSNYAESGRVQEYTTSPTELFSEREVPDTLRALLVDAILGGTVPPEVAARVREPVLLETVRLTSKGEDPPTGRDELTRFTIPFAFAILLVMAVTFSAGYLIHSLTEEKESRTIEVVLSSVSPLTLMGGKLLGLGTGGLVQVLVWLTSAWVIGSIAGSTLPLPSDFGIDATMLIMGVVFFVLGFLFFGSIVSGVGAVLPPQEGTQVAGMVNMLTMLPLLAFGHVLNYPDGAVARIFTLIPFTSPVTVMLRLSSTTLPWLDILAAALLLAASSAGVLFLAVRVFQAHLLLHGKRPGLGEIWRALRSA